MQTATGIADCFASKLKDNAGGLADFSRMIELEPKNSMAWNNRGVAKDRLGDLQSAIKDFEQAIELDANNDPAHRNLERVRGKLGEPKKPSPD